MIEHDLWGILESETPLIGQISERLNQLIKNSEQLIFSEHRAATLESELLGEEVWFEILVVFLNFGTFSVATEELQNVGMD